MKGNVTCILRGYTYEQVRSICNVLTKGEIVKDVEITMNTEGAVDIIKKIVPEFKDSLNIGAGTVISFDDLKAAIDAGAKFV